MKDAIIELVDDITAYLIETDFYEALNCYEDMDYINGGWYSQRLRDDVLGSLLTAKDRVYLIETLATYEEEDADALIERIRKL